MLKSSTIFLFCCVAAVVTTIPTSAFVIVQQQQQPTVQSTALNLFGKKSGGASSVKPTLDKSIGKYVRAAGDDGVYPYDAVGSLLRHGPAPFVQRVTSADDYEQLVLEYMALANVDRSAATGNIDAKINNAADWQYQKMEEQKGNKPPIDYTVLKVKDAILTTVWAVVVTPIAIDVVYKTVTQIGSH